MLNANWSPFRKVEPKVPYWSRGNVRCIQLTDTAGTGKRPPSTPTRAPYPIRRAALRTWVALESTDNPDTPLVGSMTAEASASTERKPPLPPSNPRLASTIGAGMAPWKLEGTVLLFAESGFGRLALIAFTRAVTLRCPSPPSDLAVPSTGLPPLTIMPASGWNARIASTAVLQAAVAFGSGMAHCGSWAARDAPNETRATVMVIMFLNEYISPPPLGSQPEGWARHDAVLKDNACASAQCSAEPTLQRGDHRSANLTARVPARTSPINQVSTWTRRAAAVIVSTSSRPAIAIMPTPRLNTRRISPSDTRPARISTRKTAGQRHARAPMTASH